MLLQLIAGKLMQVLFYLFMNIIFLSQFSQKKTHLLVTNGIYDGNSQDMILCIFQLMQTQLFTHFWFKVHIRRFLYYFFFHPRLDKQQQCKIERKSNAQVKYNPPKPEIFIGNFSTIFLVSCSFIMITALCW